MAQTQLFDNTKIINVYKSTFECYSTYATYENLIIPLYIPIWKVVLYSAKVFFLFFLMLKMETSIGYIVMQLKWFSFNNNDNILSHI